MTKMGVFVEQEFGARVATIREGDNGVEMKDNRNGTFDLTVFYIGGDDMTAFRLTQDDLRALRRALDAAMGSAICTQTSDA
jgi:hypothetical protein